MIRGGYGLFYFLDRGGINNQLAQNPPFAGSLSYSYNDGYRITFSGQAPLNSNDNRLATAALPLPSVTLNQTFLNNPVGANVIAIKPDIKTSNVQQFNIQFQQQLLVGTALSVGYVGTRGRNLSLYYNIQGTAITTGSAIPCPISRRTLGNCYPGLSSVNVRDDIGKPQYDSLQIQLERRFAKGWQYLASYTFSKTKDNGNGRSTALPTASITSSLTLLRRSIFRMFFRSNQFMSFHTDAADNSVRIFRAFLISLSAAGR